MVVMFFIAAAGCILLFFQGLKKDHSLDVYKIRQELLEEKRTEIQKTRSVYQSIIDEKERLILSLSIRDSVLAAHASEIQNKINYIESPAYVKEKIRPVDAYSDADLQRYINNLQPMPEPNDY